MTKPLPISGVDLMRKINDGVFQKAPTEYLTKVRDYVVENCDELIEIGARIRPLMVDSKQIGWVRGVHNTERKRLSRWVNEPNEFILNTLTLATSLTREEVEGLTALEIHNLVELIQTMTSYDVSLYPYLSAFCSTMTSENLWHGRGVQLTSFENKEVRMPDGKVMRILTPSDHSRLWATLCVYREQAKVRLDADWNSLLQIRPLAGKSVDPLVAELKILTRELATNSIKPWERLVKVKADVNLDDGWAHIENLNTKEGILKELHGMLAGMDKHEQVFSHFYKQQIDEAEKRKQVIAAISRPPGVYDESYTVETEEDVRNRERDLKKGKMVPPPIDRNKTEAVVRPEEKIKRYK